MDGNAEITAPKLAGSGAPPTRVRWRLSRPDDRQNPMPSIIAAAYEQPIVRLTSPIGAYYVVADPDGVRRVMLDDVANYPKHAMERRLFTAIFGEGLVTSEGEAWRARRRTMAPSFSPASVTAHVPGMAAEAEGFLARWDQAPAPEPIDIAREMSQLTLRIIARAMFSADGGALGGVMERAVAGGLAALRVGLGDFVPLVSTLKARARTRRIEAALAELDGAVGGLITERVRTGGGEDLLARLIAARDADTGAGLTGREVRDEVLTVFLAGHETTAAAMAWIWYLLSQHPWVEERLHAELDAVLGGRAPTAADLPKLNYTRMVAEEAMRLYPPTPGVNTRTARDADEICGVKIPKGGVVVLSPWVTHRHRRLWDRPERFDPERFSKAASEGRSRFAYIPFGAGPRVCVGASLAMTEILVILAVLAQHYRLALAPGHTVELLHRITLRPLGGLPMVMTRR